MSNKPCKRNIKIATKGKDNVKTQNHLFSPSVIYDNTKKIEVERKYPAFKIVTP